MALRTIVRDCGLSSALMLVLTLPGCLSLDGAKSTHEAPGADQDGDQDGDDGGGDAGGEVTDEGERCANITCPEQNSHCVGGSCICLPGYVKRPGTVGCVPPTVLLVHFDGTTPFSYQCSEYSVTGTLATQDTADAKVGDGSADLPSGACVEYELLFGGVDTSELELAYQFTLEAWIKVRSWPSLGPDAVVMSRAKDSETYWMLSVRSPGTLAFNWVTPSYGTVAAEASGLTLGTWQHVAVVMNYSSVSLFIDGTRVYEGGAAISAEPMPFAHFVLGARAFAGSATAFDGHIDEVRFSNGVARYTSDFTPAVTPYPDCF